MQSLGQRIKALREALELSQEAVGEAAGITQEHLSNIETGQRGPSLDTLRRIARALKVPAGELLDPPRRGG